jgi:hypothetical protein
MTAGTFPPVLYAERGPPVVAFSTEFSLIDLLHVHLPRTMRHLKETVVAACAFEFFRLQMVLMAEKDRGGMFRFKE